MTFHSLSAIPALPREEFLASRGVGPRGLPPRTLYLGGVECQTELVSLDQLGAWRKKHGLTFDRTAFVARVGLVNLYWPDGQQEGGLIVLDYETVT